MKLRERLDELGKMKGITKDEKGMLCSLPPIFGNTLISFLYTINIDPEEFLNMLFKHVLKTKPFIEIRYV